jgi:tetratricopeptide (TPR) repeat protein
MRFGASVIYARRPFGTAALKIKTEEVDPESASAMSVLGEIAAGKGVSLALRVVTGAVREFVKQDALGRLLVLLHADFGTRTQLQRDAFYSWRSHADLEEALRAALGGQAPVDPFKSRLAALVSERLVRTDDAERPALAAEFADAVFVAAPIAADGGSQALAMVLARIEQGQGSLLEAIEGPAGPTSTNLAQALVIGPLRTVQATEEVAEAERLSEAGEYLAAGAALLAVVRRLDEEDLTFAADNLRQRAAAHLAAGGAVDDAAELLLRTAWARIERGETRAAALIVGALRDLLGPEDAWIADGVEARAGWAEGGEVAVQALARAAEASAGRDDHRAWVAAHVELLALGERWEEVLHATGDISDADPQDGPTLQIILDALDARSASDGPAAVEDRWLAVLRWADSDAARRSQAIAWQRRGLALARREDVSQALDAYRRAMSAWAAVPGHEEQAADAFFSLQAAAITNAKPIPDMELRPMAWSLRGSSATSVAVADRLERDAMGNRLGGRLPDALSGYLNAHLIHHRVGSLHGRLETAKRIAEIYAHAGEPALALSYYLKAGKGQEAAHLAAQMPGQTVAVELSVEGPRWERAAALHVIAEVGRALPPEFVASITEALLAEAAGEPDAFAAPQPTLAARRALAAVSLSVAEDMRDAVFARLEQYLRDGLYDQIKSSAQALTLATRANLVDARAALVAKFIADPYNSSISCSWLAAGAPRHKVIRDALLTASADGNDAALEPLAMAGLVGEGELQDRVDAATLRAAEVVTVERSADDDGRETVSVGMGLSFEGPAVVARGSRPEARGALIGRMLEIVSSDEEPQINRSSAAGALFNLAPSMDTEQAGQVAAAVAPLALGNYRPSRFDLDQAHPLSRWQIRIGVPNQLRASAIGTLAQLLSKHDQLDRAPLHEAVRSAVRSPAGAVVAAAFDAAARLPQLDLGVEPEDGFYHPDPAVRQAALVAWTARHGGLPSTELVDMLAADPGINVRLQLCAMAGQAGEKGRELLERLAAHDPDAFVRAKAASWARGEDLDENRD